MFPFCSTGDSEQPECQIKVLRTQLNETSYYKAGGNNN